MVCNTLCTSQLLLSMCFQTRRVEVLNSVIGCWTALNMVKCSKAFPIRYYHAKTLSRFFRKQMLLHKKIT